jgi:hypothetical protein
MQDEKSFCEKNLALLKYFKFHFVRQKALIFLKKIYHLFIYKYKKFIYWHKMIFTLSDSKKSNPRED